MLSIHPYSRNVNFAIDLVVLPVNCVGIYEPYRHKEFRSKFPSIYDNYQLAGNQNKLVMNHVYVIKTELNYPSYIVLLPTIHTTRNPESYEYIDSCLVELDEKLKEVKVNSVAILPLSCTLDFRKLLPIIKLNLANSIKYKDIFLYTVAK